MWILYHSTVKGFVALTSNCPLKWLFYAGTCNKSNKSQSTSLCIKLSAIHATQNIPWPGVMLLKNVFTCRVFSMRPCITFCKHDKHSKERLFIVYRDRNQSIKRQEFKNISPSIHSGNTGSNYKWSIDQSIIINLI